MAKEAAFRNQAKYGGFDMTDQAYKRGLEQAQRGDKATLRHENGNERADAAEFDCNDLFRGPCSVEKICTICCIVVICAIAVPIGIAAYEIASGPFKHHDTDASTNSTAGSRHLGFLALQDAGDQSDILLGDYFYHND